MLRTSIVGRCLPALLLVLAACQRNESAADSTAIMADTSAAAAAAAAPPAAAAPVTLTVAARPGEAVYLTDASGRAVYYIGSPDGKAVVECTGDCATAFDPVTGRAVVATGDTTVQVALIGQVTLPDGSTQVTYGGKPLYYHPADQPADSARGQGVTAGTGKAFLIGPDGSQATRGGT